MEAERALRALLATEPDDAQALFLLGETTLVMGRMAEAADLLGRALQLRPMHRLTRIALARALLAADRAEEALTVLAPLATDPELAAAQLLCGTALNALGRPAEAVEAFTRVLTVTPDDAEAHLNLGNAYESLNQGDLAERHVRQAIGLNPDLAEAHASLGHLLAGRGRIAESVAASGRAIALQPDLAAAHWNQGVALLLGGDMAAGWEKYEWRKRRFPASFASLPGEQWAGGPLAGRTILVVAEQGYGDTIQFARYLPLLHRNGATVVVDCPASLAHLLRTQAWPATTCTSRRRPYYDLWVDQMSLPRLFGTTTATVPLPAGYLAPDHAQTLAWDGALPRCLRVGLVWAGNPRHSNDRRRSMPAAALRHLLAERRAAFVSLQTGPSAADVAELPGVLDVSGKLVDWAATAAVIGALDLVITVDTAVAHLAGALGIPVWLMLPAAPDWRWMLDREDTPWYASMRLFRQTTPGDWGEVVARVKRALADSTRPAGNLLYTMAMPPLTCSVAPVTQPASLDAR